MRGARLLAVAVAAVFAAGASAADPVPDKDQAGKSPPPKKKKSMHMNEPIANQMKKEGMTQGSVHAGAERKSREMEPMIEEEEKKMPEKKGP
jgi:hypothetical protein